MTKQNAELIFEDGMSIRILNGNFDSLEVTLPTEIPRQSEPPKPVEEEKIAPKKIPKKRKDAEGVVARTVTVCGSGGPFDTPMGIDVDRFGNAYVADSKNHCV